MIEFIADATSQPVISQWAQDVIAILGSIWGLIGGTAGVLAIIVALKQAGIIGKVKDQSETNSEVIVQQHEKINEIAEKNAADVAPLPPLPPKVKANE